MPFLMMTTEGLGSGRSIKGASMSIRKAVMPNGRAAVPGGVNVCYGIQVYGDQRELEGKLEGTIGTLQRLGFSIAETIKDIMAEYHLKENDATEAVRKYWKEITSNSDEKKKKKKKKK